MDDRQVASLMRIDKDTFITWSLCLPFLYSLCIKCMHRGHVFI